MAHLTSLICDRNACLLFRVNQALAKADVYVQEQARYSITVLQYYSITSLHYYIILYFLERCAHLDLCFIHIVHG